MSTKTRPQVGDTIRLTANVLAPLVAGSEHTVIALSASPRSDALWIEVDGTRHFIYPSEYEAVGQEVILDVHDAYHQEEDTPAAPAVAEDEEDNEQALAEAVENIETHEQLRLFETDTLPEEPHPTFAEALAPVLHDPAHLEERLSALDITTLRRLSRGGLVQGGYAMKKPDLVKAIAAAAPDLDVDAALEAL